MGEQILEILQQVNTVLWSSWTLYLLLGAGLLFSIWTKFSQFRILTHGFQVIRGKYDNPDDPGAINHFQALSAALSGTIGLGNIGKAVACRAKGFEMKILATEILPDFDFIRKHNIELIPLDDLLQRSDFVSLHVRLNPETDGMIGARELAQ